MNDAVALQLHETQALVKIINANTTYCWWQRAGGKTGGGIGPRVEELIRKMPKSQILLFSDTYERLKNRIVPNILSFMETKMGMVEGVDFVRYKKPPDTFDQPFIKLDDYSNVIAFSSGACLCLVSLKVEGSANAYNAQAAIGDEVKFCKEAQINTEVIPALRGLQEMYGHLPEYLSVWMFSDKFGPNTKWMLAKRKQVNHKAVESVYVMQMEVFRLEGLMREAKSTATQYKYKAEIEKYERAMNEIRKDLVFVAEMKPYENLRVVGDRYFRLQKRICTQYEFDVAILNKDPDKVELCFYPMLSARHKVEAPMYNPNLPFYGAMDYNYRISPLVLAQVGYVADNPFKTINIIDDLYTLHPKGMKEVIDAFANKYAQHANKVLYYIFDHTAIGRNPLNTTYRDSFIKYLRAHDWRVVECYIGEAPDHHIKYKNINEWLADTGINSIRIQSTCTTLFKSMEQTPAKIIGEQTKKDKSKEKDEKFPAEEAPHFGDAFDMLLEGMFGLDLVVGDNSFVGLPIRTS